MKAVQSVLNEGYYYNNSYTKKIFKTIHEGKSSQRSLRSLQLTDREHRFLQWAGTDLTYKEIGSIMKISSRAVDKIRNSLFEKLNVKSRQTLSLVAFENGLAQKRA